MGLARPLAYADDKFLQGALAPTMPAFAALTALAASPSLHCQPAKCAVHSVDHGRRHCCCGQTWCEACMQGPATGASVGTPPSRPLASKAVPYEPAICPLPLFCPGVTPKNCTSIGLFECARPCSDCRAPQSTLKVDLQSTPHMKDSHLWAHLPP
jgi:hypothetical protein